jgi:hypothetical protein
MYISARWVVTAADEYGHTSSSFSGRPFMPPLGSCLSASHHPSVGTSTTSNRSRIASAAVHTHTARGRKNTCQYSKEAHRRKAYRENVWEMRDTYLVLRGSRSQRFDQSLRQSCGTRQGRRLCARDRGDRARRGGIAPIRRSRGNACPSRQRRRRRRRLRVVVGPG